MADPTLQEALNFTDEDLAANREGRLGPTQQGRLTRTKGRSQVINLVSAAVFVVIMIVIGVYVLPMYLTGPSAQAAPIIVGVLIAVVLIILLTTWRSRRKLARLDGPVIWTAGEASARMGGAQVSGGALMPMYRLSIGEVTFALASPEPMRAFVNGHQYRGYYVQGTTPVLVSAEKL
jgi:hypothetical protein